jgi:hypothetical protein
VRPRASFRSAAAILLTAAALVSGCSHKLAPVDLGSAPSTTIFVQGPVDTVNHIVNLHWFGSDPHGYVVGFEVRLLNPSAPADSAWRFTDRKDTLLTVYTPAGFTEAVFEARAVNDRGVHDPDPARQTFDFSNRPPLVHITSAPNAIDHSDTTFASITVTWEVFDVDGDAGAARFRVWLDGSADTPEVSDGTTFTMPSARFLQGGVYRSGPRTLYVQAVDDGGMAGGIDSCTWYVRQPVTGTRARLLVVDDARYTGGAKTRVDTLYANAIARTGVDPTSVRVLHLAGSQPFRSASDLAQTFGLYENVIWYRGETDTVSSVLTSYGAGVGRYLEAGGRMFLESLNLIRAFSSPGAFDLEFVDRYLDSDGVFVFGQPPDSSARWGVSSVHPTVLRSALLADSLIGKRNIGGLRAFVSRSRSEMLLIVPPDGLTQHNPIEMPIALDVPQPGGGRFMVTTFPLVSGSVDTSPSDSTFVPYPFPQRASVVLLGMLRRLGLGP